MKIKYLPFLLIHFLFNSLTASAQSWLWGVQGSGGLKADLYANNTATNKTGNVYQAGSFKNSITFGTTTLYSTASFAAYLVKYDENGNLLWAAQSINPDMLGFAEGNSVATDDSDNSYLAGTILDNNLTLFGNDTLTENNQLYLVKYSPNGNIAWAKQPSINTVKGAGNAVAVDKFGHEYVTGMNVYLIKYDRNGNIVWTTVPKSNGSSSGTGITTDDNGNIYVTGYFQDSLTFGAYKLYSPNSGVFIAKLDSNGNTLWAQQSYHTPSYVPQYFNNNPALTAVVTDKSGAAYLTGAFTDTITFASYTFTTPNYNTFSFFLLKYDKDGTIAWSKTATLGWGSYSMCSDDSNHIYISGAEAFTGQIDSLVFANDSISVLHPMDGSPSFLLKLDTSGNVLCSSTLPTAGANINAVTTDPTGQFVYMGGSFYDSLIFGIDTLTDNSGATEPYIARWQSCTECNLVVTTSPQPAPICDGQSVSLGVSGGSNYTWSPVAGLNTTTGDTVVATPSVTTTYTISSTSGNCSGNGQIVVTVNPIPKVQVAPPSTIICTYQGATLIASGADTYQWTPSTGLNTSIGDSVLAEPTVNTTYTIVGTSNGCSDSAQSYINLIPAPNVPTITVKGDTLISSATHDNQWFRNDSLIPGANDSIYITGGKNGWYFVEVTNLANGCSTNSDSTYSSDSTTGINQSRLSRGQISIYPNPFSNNVIVKINSSTVNIKDWNLEVMDELGRIIYVLPSLNYTNEIDLSSLPAAMYFIRVLNKTTITVAPVVKVTN